MGADIQTERGNRVKADAPIFQGLKDLPEKTTMTISEPSATRQMLEDCWRLRLEETRVHYRKATDQYRKLLQDQPAGRPQDPNGALALARQAESEARAEYARVLRVFTELIVNGKMPEERSVAGWNGL
jgi:hypothetical protein